METQTLESRLEQISLNESNEENVVTSYHKSKVSQSLASDDQTF
jgi:hypothetical protein